MSIVKKELTITVRTTPPLAPSRAIARETAFLTNSCHITQDHQQIKATHQHLGDKLNQIKHWKQNQNLTQTMGENRILALKLSFREHNTINR